MHVSSHNELIIRSLFSKLSPAESRLWAPPLLEKRASTSRVIRSPCTSSASVLATLPGRRARHGSLDASVLPSGGGVRLRSLSAAAKAASARAASAVCIRARRQNAGRARRSAGRAGAGGPQGARRGDDAAQEGDAEVGSSGLDVLLHPVLLHDPARHQGRAGTPHHAPSASPPPPG